jgi:hypothetical protein
MIEFEIEKLIEQVRDRKITAEAFVDKCEAIVNNFNKELEKQGEAAYAEELSKTKEQDENNS